MLSRQKTLLFLLQKVARPVDRMQLVKWCFLLRHEFPSKGGKSFYDFVSYKHGPFSFALYHEMGKLERCGLLLTSGNSVGVRRDGFYAVASPPAAVVADIDRLLYQFAAMPLRSLIHYVYSRYPTYTVNSEWRPLAARPETQRAVFTSGYEGLSVDAFLNRLVRSGVRRVIDVRRNAVSRRYGFHGTTLSRLLGHLGIDYVHFPELGIAAASRKKLSTRESYRRLLRDYQSTTLKMEKVAVAEVARLVAEIPSVLTCMEADPAYCHRSLLAIRVAELTQLPIVDILNQ